VKIVKIIIWTKGPKDEEEICGLRARYEFMNSEGKIVRMYGQKMVLDGIDELTKNIIKFQKGDYLQYIQGY
jgi:hypothetical protein